MLSRLLGASRFLVMLGVVGTFVLAVALLVYGGVQTVQLVSLTLQAGAVSSKGGKTLALEVIQIADLFLLGTVMYIIAVGLYELFIDERITLPSWLVIKSLDDLKDKLVGVVMLMIGVIFLGQVATWDGQRDLLGYGVANAAVIIALAYFQSQKPKKINPSHMVKFLFTVH